MVIKGFKEFIVRGNVVDLAVGVVIGAAFSGMVNALVADLLTPLLGAIFQAPDFSHLQFTINNSIFRFGDFINHVISFLIVAASVYFLVILPLNSFIEVRKNRSGKKACPECISDIPLRAKRCPFCTSPQPLESIEELV